MSDNRAGAIPKLLALLGCAAATAFAQTQETNSASCTSVTAPLLLSNRTTLDAQTRLYKIEADRVTRVTAYDLNIRDGRLGSAIWQSQLPMKSSQAIASPAAASLDAVFIGPPRAKHSRDPSYSRFVQATAKRDPTLYIAARDGRLYAVDAHTGQSVQVNVEQTGEPVGSQLATATLPFGSEWRTLLVALSNSSPAVLHALDVTDPSQPTAVWSRTIEMPTSSGHANKPVLVRLKQTPAVLLTASNTLHIYEAASGMKLREIAIDSNATLLTDPLAVDLDLDGKVERAYAGDNQGNVWRFDLSSAEPEQWQLAFGNRPLSSVTDDNGRPSAILARPEIALSRDARVPIILFPAGSVRGLAFFGIYDRDMPVTGSTGMWRTPLPPNDHLSVSAPRVHDGEVIYTLSTQREAICHTSVKRLVAFSIEDGSQRMTMALSGIKDEQEQGIELPMAKGAANKPVILDQLTPSGACARHYYLGLEASAQDGIGVLHETGKCRADTFGRQSWRQLR